MNTLDHPVSESGGWVHIVPRGEFPHRETRRIQVIDDRALELIEQNFSEDAARTNFAGVLVDQDHFSYDMDKSSSAFGWLKGLDRRSDGLWGRIDFSDEGAAAVRNRRHKFVSPVFDRVEQLGGDRVRPVRIDSVGFTNNPNFKGMSPMSNRGGDSNHEGIDHQGSPVEPSRFASDLLLALANRDTSAPTFELRRENVLRRNPILAKAERGERIFPNRAYAPDLVLSAQDRSAVTDGAKLLEERMERAWAARQQNNPLPLFAHAAQLDRMAIKYVSDVAAKHGIDYVAALRFMEEADPLLFATWCVNQLPGQPGETRSFR